MTGTNTPIEVENVSKEFRIYEDKGHTFKDRILFRGRNRYRQHRVLNNISFSVNRGEALGLIGHNGCGKSTTLKLLNRILYPDSGSIRMHGRVSSLIELGAGFHPDMSGRENIYINASIFGLKKSEINARLDDIIRFSELEEDIDKPVRTYSSGMYMRLAFSIAINVDADILLIDEILAVGDANFQEKCFRRLSEIKKTGTVIVIVSHSMEQIKGICDRVIWLDKGSIRLDGDAVYVTDEYLLQMRLKAKEHEKRERERLSGLFPEDPSDKYPCINVTGGQTSMYAYRKGTMAVRFENIKMTGKEGIPTQQFTYNDPMKIIFSLADGATLDRCNILFNILRNDGVLCTTFAADQSLGGYILPSEYTKQGTFSIEALALANGHYILDAVIVDPNGKEQDLLGHLIEFEVKSPGEFGIGFVAMKTSWENKR